MSNTRMRIGVLGRGNIASGLGAGWRAAGHEVLTGSRSGDVSLAEAGGFGDVVLLAVPADAVPEVLVHVPPGRVVIDCTNDVTPGFLVAHPYEGILAARPDLQVVKAFNLCHDSVWRAPSRVFDGRPLAVPMCGPAEAKEVVARLASDLGCTRSMPAGPNARRCWRRPRPSRSDCGSRAPTHRPSCSRCGPAYWPVEARS